MELRIVNIDSDTTHVDVHAENQIDEMSVTK